MALTKIPRPGPMGPCTETANMIAHAQGMITSLHQLHLKVTGPGSYAAHKALNEFYDGMPDLVDAVAEQYQGAREKLLDIPAPAPYKCGSVPEALAHLKELYNEIQELQKIMPFSEIVNQLDEMKSLIASTKYKLMFLS
jgi:DNA-binding ferritin-like protein